MFVINIMTLLSLFCCSSVAKKVPINYSKIFLCNEFYKNISTEIFLIFQLDSLLSDKYYNNIYNYMHYDYIGSPFFHKNNKYVGCGGLSLRKKSKMIEIINDKNYNTEDNKALLEDLYFC